MSDTKLCVDRYGLASPTFYYNQSSSSSDEYHIGDDGYGTSQSGESSPERFGELTKSKVKVEKRKRNQRQKERKAIEGHYFDQLKKILSKLDLVAPKKGARGITQYEILQITRETIQKCIQQQKADRRVRMEENARAMMKEEDQVHPNTS